VVLWRASAEEDGTLTYDGGAGQLRPGDVVSIPSDETAGLTLRERTVRVLREAERAGLTVGRLEDYV